MERNIAGGGFTCGQAGWCSTSYSFTVLDSLRGVDKFTEALTGRTTIGDSSACDLPAFRVILELEGRRVTERGDFVLGGRDERGDDAPRAGAMYDTCLRSVWMDCACASVFVLRLASRSTHPRRVCTRVRVIDARNSYHRELYVTSCRCRNFRHVNSTHTHVCGPKQPRAHRAV